MFFKINNKLILFIHIPKCGGTTIEKILNRKQKNEEILLDHSITNLEKLWGQHNYNHLQHLTFSQIFNDYQLSHKNQIKNIDFIFTIVRNPIDRIISEANWQINNEYFQYNFSWENIIKGFIDKSPKKFCHYINQKEFINNYEKHINIYSLDNLKKLKIDLYYKVGIDIDLEKSFYNRSRKVFDIKNISSKVREKIIECSIIDINYFCNNRKKFKNITDDFFTKLIL